MHAAICTAHHVLTHTAHMQASWVTHWQVSNASAPWITLFGDFYPGVASIEAQTGNPLETVSFPQEQHANHIDDVLYALEGMTARPSTPSGKARTLKFGTVTFAVS